MPTLKSPKRKPRKLKNGLTNLRGKKVGYLLVLQKMQTSKKHARWKVKCTASGCGKVFVIPHYCLMRKEPKTHCGCQLGGLPKKYKREYHSWWDAKNRCHNPNHPSYPYYGAKGIKMCDRWRNSFEHFLADMGPCPKGFSLDRIDPYGNYERTKEDGTLQVRWADDLTQARNKKKSKYVKHPKTGERVLAAALADEFGWTYQKLRAYMLARGLWKEI